MNRLYKTITILITSVIVTACGGDSSGDKSKHGLINHKPTTKTQN